MTQFLTTDGGQVADEVTRLTVAVEEVVTARPELVRSLVADVTRVGGAEIIAARRDALRANMGVTLRAMKAAAESSPATGVR
jgi:hypothetical protein